MVHIITRAKKNVVAYLEPSMPLANRRGAKPKYGKKLRLYDLFSEMADDFTTTQCVLYGKSETISYLCLNLLWKPVQQKLRFVIAITPRGKIVLICSDLTLDPIEILKLYSLRSRIETMFSVLKNIIGGLSYHFWCKCLEPQSRRPKKNFILTAPNLEDLPQIRRTWKAIEGFVNFAAIAQGLLQLTACHYHKCLWFHNHVWLRTYSSQVPSEHVTKEILARSFIHQLRNFASNAILDIIRSKQQRPNSTSGKHPLLTSGP